jgi:toxin secretion/phage lysis holin
MGLLIAAIWKKSEKSKTGALSSWSAWKGLCRKGISLLFVLIAHRLDLALGVNYIRTAVIIGFIINELISITENAGIMGVPIPGVITKAIDMLKQKTEDKNENS